MSLVPALGGVGGGRYVAPGPGPVSVDKLAGRGEELVGVGSEIVSLGLDQVSGKLLGSVAVKKCKSR